MPKELFSFGDEEMDSAAEQGWADTERPEPHGAVGVLDRPSPGLGDIDLAEVGAGEGARRSRGGSRPTSSENRKLSPRRMHWASATALLLFVAIVAGIAISAIDGDRAPQAVNPAQAPAPADLAQQQERAAAQERARLRAEGQREAERQRVARQRQQTRRQAKRRRARRIAKQRRHAQRQRQQDAAPQSSAQTYEPAPPPPPPPPEATSEPSPPPPEGDGGGGGLRDGSTSAEFGL